VKLGVVVGVVLALALAAAGVWAYLDERDSRRAEVTRLEGRVAAVHRDLVATRKENALLAARVRAVSARMRKARFNLTPLAARIRRSVFTVIAALDEGSGFAGWVRDGSTYVVTANHVVTLSVLAGKPVRPAPAAGPEVARPRRARRRGERPVRDPRDRPDRAAALAAAGLPPARAG
jgi:hypothetical protein